MPIAVPFLRIFLNAGHGLNNRIADPPTFDTGATGCNRSEYEMVSALVDAVDRDDVVQTPSCGPSCVRKHIVVDSEVESHLSYLVHWLNGYRTPFDAVLSVHMNQSDDPKATGTEIYVSNCASDERIGQAEAIGRAVAHVLGLHFRGVKRSGESQHPSLAILDRTKAAAFLLELGFISNQSDVDAVVANGHAALKAALDTIINFKGAMSNEH